MTGIRCSWKPAILVALSLFATIGTAFAQTATATKEPIPDWLAWRVFHDSLVFYAKQSPEHVRDMLSKEFHLNAKQAAAFQDAGQTYVAEIQRIEVDARAETQKRYKDITVPFATTMPATAVKVTPGPHESVTQRAKEDGFFEEIEGKKQAALTAHLLGLRETISSAQIEQMQKYVHASVVPHITRQTNTPNVFDHGVRLPAVSPSAGGAK